MQISSLINLISSWSRLILSSSLLMSPSHRNRFFRKSSPNLITSRSWILLTSISKSVLRPKFPIRSFFFIPSFLSFNSISSRSRYIISNYIIIKISPSTSPNSIIRSFFLITSMTISSRSRTQASFLFSLLASHSILRSFSFRNSIITSRSRSFFFVIHRFSFPRPYYSP